LAKNDANKRPFEPGRANSGFYSYPVHMDDPAESDDDVTTEQATRLVVAPEEFPEGPYGSFDEEKLGKVSEWRPGQAVAQRFRDTNPISSNRTEVFEEPPFHDPSSEVEGPN
jgi:hypothetical protein